MSNDITLSVPARNISKLSLNTKALHCICLNYCSTHTKQTMVVNKVKKNMIENLSLKCIINWWIKVI